MTSSQKCNTWFAGCSEWKFIVQGFSATRLQHLSVHYSCDQPEWDKSHWWDTWNSTGSTETTKNASDSSEKLRGDSDDCQMFLAFFTLIIQQWIYVSLTSAIRYGFFQSLRTNTLRRLNSNTWKHMAKTHWREDVRFAILQQCEIREEEEKKPCWEFQSSHWDFWCFIL